MLRFNGKASTIVCGDIYIAARSVGGNATLSKCDADGFCTYTAVIPQSRIEDFVFILEERAAM